MDELKATHTNYRHPRHLRVEDGVTRKAWNAVRGWHETNAVSMAPSHSRYAALSRKSLPCYTCGEGKPCHVCGNPEKPRAYNG